MNQWVSYLLSVGAMAKEMTKKKIGSTLEDRLKTGDENRIDAAVVLRPE